MLNWLRHLDRLLRGEATSLPELQREQIDIPIVGISVVVAILGLIYGACMGLFAITGSGNNSAMQIPAAMLKVPALFFLTLIVTYPSLYVFNALVGSRLRIGALTRLLIGSLAIMLAILASLGPIVAFFSVSTTSYSFILLLNIIVYALSGFLGLGFLLRTLHRITIARMFAPPPIPAEQVATEQPAEGQPLPPTKLFPPGALEPIDGQVLGPHVKTIFRIWVIVFGFVGAQMAWILRPFVGHPDKPFEWFRHRESNFFQGVWELLKNFLGN